MCSTTIEQVLIRIREEFPGATTTFTPDGTGGGSVVIEPVDIGTRYAPTATWFGAHLSHALPFADVYPLFIGSNVVRKDGAAHQAPITVGHTFANRPALQVSKRTNNLLATPEGAALKFTKVLHYIKEVAP